MTNESGGRQCTDCPAQTVRATEGILARTPWAGPAQKLAQLCDADLRSTDPEIRLAAAAVTAGAAIPDPSATGRAFHAVVSAACGYLRTQPSQRSVRAAGQRLQRALAGVIGDVAKEVGE